MNWFPFTLYLLLKIVLGVTLLRRFPATMRSSGRLLATLLLIIVSMMFDTFISGLFQSLDATHLNIMAALTLGAVFIWSARRPTIPPLNIHAPITRAPALLKAQVILWIVISILMLVPLFDSIQDATHTLIQSDRVFRIAFTQQHHAFVSPHHFPPEIATTPLLIDLPFQIAFAFHSIPLASLLSVIALILLYALSLFTITLQLSAHRWYAAAAAVFGLLALLLFWQHDINLLDVLPVALLIISFVFDRVRLEYPANNWFILLSVLAFGFALSMIGSIPLAMLLSIFLYHRLRPLEQPYHRTAWLVALSLTFLPMLFQMIAWNNQVIDFLLRTPSLAFCIELATASLIISTFSHPKWVQKITIVATVAMLASVGYLLSNPHQNEKLSTFAQFAQANLSSSPVALSTIAIFETESLLDNHGSLREIVPVDPRMPFREAQRYARRHRCEWLIIARNEKSPLPSETAILQNWQPVFSDRVFSTDGKPLRVVVYRLVIAGVA